MQAIERKKERKKERVAIRSTSTNPAKRERCIFATGRPAAA